MSTARLFVGMGRPSSARFPTRTQQMGREGLALEGSHVQRNHSRLVPSRQRRETQTARLRIPWTQWAQVGRPHPDKLRGCGCVARSGTGPNCLECSGRWILSPSHEKKCLCKTAPGQVHERTNARLIVSERNSYLFAIYCTPTGKQCRVFGE